jgi:cytoskeletal protein CcmA (bactofilin family)
MGGDISIESKVGGEVFATGGNITLTRAASVGRGAAFFGGNITVDGRVDGDLKATAQKITIDGEVRGNARLSGETIELGPRARIGGAVTYSSPSELKKAEGATIAGVVTREQDGARPGRPGAGRSWERSYSGPSWVGVLMSFLALLAVAAIFILAVPRFGDEASRRIQSSPGMALAVGFAAAVAVPVLAVLLFVTILGIPLGIALLALYPALLLGGFVVGVLFVARLLVRAMRKEPPRTFGASMGYFAVALVLMLLVGTVPFVGALALALLGLAGMGACVLELHSRRKGPPDRQGGQVPMPRPA